VFQVPANPIQGPAHNYVESRSAGVEEEAIETWSSVLRSAHFVGVFSVDDPAPRVAVATELEELVLAGLGSVEGADAGVDGGLHGNTAASFPGGMPLSFGTILTVILCSLRYARIRGGSTRSVPGRKSQIAGVVPAQHVLKGDQRVIGFGDTGGSELIAIRMRSTTPPDSP
jgi:hypothetical protein